MSYCAQLKAELCRQRELGRREMTAMLYGLLYAGRDNDGMRVVQTENRDVVDAARALAEAVFPQARHETTRRVRCGSSLYFFGFKAGETAPRELFGSYDSISAAVSGDDKESGAFLRGVFLSCGAMTDPDKSFHLELNLSDNKRAQALCDFIAEHGITLKTTLRKRRTGDEGRLVIYAKESLIIEDFLTYIGAAERAMEIMQIKVERSFRNRANRTVNCDSANLDKTVDAANRICEDIELIFSANGKDSLKPELLETALIRLENRESSLSELCELFDPPISRSGLNHRLKKLSAIAARIRGEE